MREEPGVQSPALTLTLARRSGSCRDFAALLMEACRHVGLASRFVSGYLYAPGVQAAQGSTHARAEVSTSPAPAGRDSIPPAAR